MFWVYLRRELRRRIRQAVFIAVGLALGIGLVITVTSAATGVRNAQGAVLQSLYGVGTDLTVTQPPKQGAGSGISFGFKQQIKQGRSGQITAGTKINENELQNTEYGSLTAAQLAAVSRQQHVTAAAAALSLTDITVTGTVPPLSAGSGTFSSSFTTSTFTVDGVDVAHSSPGPLSSATVTAGRGFAHADATADVALADSGYAAANKLKTGSTVEVGNTKFTVVGIVGVPEGSSPPNLYIPLAKAQQIGVTGSAKMTNQVNTIYVTADSASN